VSPRLLTSSSVTDRRSSAAGIFDSRAFAKDRSGKDKIKKEGDVADSTGTSTPAKTDADGDVKMERDAGDDAPAVASGSGSGRASPAKAAPVVAKSASASRSTSNSRSGKPRDPSKEAAVEKRLALLRSEEGSRGLVVRRYFALLLPTLVDVYAASVNTQVRTKAVLGMLKIVDFCDSENLAHILQVRPLPPSSLPLPLTNEYVQDVPMAAFLAAMLAVRDQSPLVTSALQLVDLLLSKMPEAYQYLFRREGATHEIERLASAPILYVSSKSKKSSPSRTPTTGAAPSGIAKALQQHAAGDAEKKIASVEAQTMDMVTYRARYLRDLFANNKSEAAVNARAALDKIENLVSRLKDAVASDLQEEEVVSLLKDFSALFADAKNPLSSFELRETGMVEGLLKFSTEVSSTGCTSLFPPSPCTGLTIVYSPVSVVERQELLAKAFLPQLEMGTPTVAFSILVKRLQESLSRMEEFEVVLASQNGNEGMFRLRSSS
jgi:E3 ubiquitin-protein ligase TRIP12